MPRRRRLAVSAVGALAVLAAGAPGALGADQATLRLLGSSPIYAKTVAVHKAGGGDVNVKPARYHYRITTPAGVSEASGNCVDLSHYIVTGRDYAVELQDAHDDPALGSPGFKAAGWLLSQSDGLIASAADPGLEAGAIQVAIWQLSGQARGLDAPTSDLALNARVNTLRALATGKEVPSQLAVTIAGTDTCVDTAAPVTVTGTPGAEVDLHATGGGTVQPDHVTLDEMGVGSATVRAGGAAATVTVHAETVAPTMLRATKLPGQTAPQDQLFLRPGVLGADDSQPFVNCDLNTFSAPDVPGLTAPADAPPPPAAPAPAPAAPAQALELDLRTPHLAAPGGVAVYRLRVANTGTRTVRNVTVAQRLDRGIAPISTRAPKGTRSTINRGAARWRLAALKPGATATLTLKVRVGRRAAGAIAHTSATVRSAKARASAEGATSIVRRVGKTEQGF
jgi:uncharacterized repeat protein (TIGR01451 family)